MSRKRRQANVPVKAGPPKSNRTEAPWYRKAWGSRPESKQRRREGVTHDGA